MEWIQLIIKKILTVDMKSAVGRLKFRSIKVSAKGQITLPSDIQKEMGISKGDEILLITKGGKIILERPERVAKKFKDEFADLRLLSERSLGKIWLNKEDEVWNSI
jgi:AbrB family looped-hinge helix DNA binding protein